MVTTDDILSFLGHRTYIGVSGKSYRLHSGLFLAVFVLIRGLSPAPGFGLGFFVVGFSFAAFSFRSRGVVRNYGSVSVGDDYVIQTDGFYVSSIGIVSRINTLKYE